MSNESFLLSIAGEKMQAEKRVDGDENLKNTSFMTSVGIIEQ